MLLTGFTQGEEITVELRSQKKTEIHADRFQYSTTTQTWKASETAIIVCDFWDHHHCLNAVRRMKEFGPRLNRLIQQSRDQGMTIIHSPSDCMPAYQQHPARKRALAAPFSTAPQGIVHWCSRIPAEEQAAYPIDQSDGGEDDDPAEHRQWARELEALGRNPNLPWKKQNSMIPIDAPRDYISDRGQEVWNVLQAKKIKNVILVGVHTNMCVLGRPFGLRQMKRNGMNVVLMRDMTDTMYNPKRWPYVSHYAGTDLVISHIEKFVCPTISSNQLLKGKEFTFKNDNRPHLAVVIGEQEYRTEQTLPHFCETWLKDFRTTFVHAHPDDRNHFPGLEGIIDADLVLISVRRRVLKPAQMKIFREFEAAGKPILGIRTASHAFSLRGKPTPKGYQAWPEWDSSVFGGSYTNHHGNKLKSIVTYTETASRHPLTRELALDPPINKDDPRKNLKRFGQHGSLYKTAPLAQGTQVLLMGSVIGHPPEPVAWTFSRVNGGLSFYTSLGHAKDFDNTEFRGLLRNAIYWSAKTPLPHSSGTGGQTHWSNIQSIQRPRDPQLRLKYHFKSKDQLTPSHTYIAFRSVVRIPGSWLKNPLTLSIDSPDARCWLNGKPLPSKTSATTSNFSLPSNLVEKDDANWLMIGMRIMAKQKPNAAWVPVITSAQRKKRLVSWEWAPATKGFSVTSKISLPAKFGGRTDIYHGLPE